MISIRESIPTDNHALLELTRATPMDGSISLRIDRDPEFTTLNTLRGKGSTFLVTKSDRVLGCVSASVATKYVCGVPEQVGYAADLKVDRDARGSMLAYRLMRAAYQYSLDSGARICYCVVADGNKNAFVLFNDRAKFPPAIQLGRFFVYSMLPTPIRHRTAGYSVHSVNPTELSEFFRFVNNTNSDMLFAPHLRMTDDLSTTAHSEPSTSTLVARHQGRIVATLATRDMSFCKSNVLIDMPAYLRFSVFSLRAISKMIPVIHAPVVGESVRILYIRHVSVTRGHERALRLLISAARKLAFSLRYSFVTIGLHERDQRRELLRLIPRFLFISRGFAVSEDRSSARMSALTRSVPFEDFALV